MQMDALEIELAQELEKENPAADFLRANEYAGSPERKSLNGTHASLKKSGSNLTAPAAANNAAAAGTSAAAATAPPATPTPPTHMTSGGDTLTDGKTDRAAVKLEKLRAVSC